MKKICLIGILFLLSTNIFSQAVEKGNFVIEPYVGFPNVSKIVLKNIKRIHDSELKSTGPFGIKVDYFFKDKISFGINCIYNSYNIKGQIDSLNTNNVVDSTYFITVDMQRFRFQANAKYHFFVGEKLDTYVGFGFGMNSRKYTFDSSFPNLNEKSIFATVLPVSARFDLGFRYFLSKNVGFNFEMGIGGPIMIAGLTVKI
ncbi:MAG: outer membrane beta-barrel protein [Bacteroidota bacterium]